jgi:hypothetical protein
LIHVAPRCKYKIKLSKVFYLYRFFEDLYFQVEFRASVSKIQNGVWNQSLNETKMTRSEVSQIHKDKDIIYLK